MGFVNEFKTFAFKGNVIDLAVGIVIGAAFGKIVSSLVDDIITPAILAPALKAANLTNLTQLVIPGTAIKYGSFLAAVISFLIVALALFIVIQAINKMKRKEPIAEAAPVVIVASKEEVLLGEIRDLLAQRNSL
ncbi:MAG: large conductance mechanosensitive channel protein MscL [Sphingobacteriaceae bacterium]|nr:MAG: large conductance mechanosensitive channel protein MscL [Sphingobacteriaceae bacterium]